jgi:hypothetical protein
MTLSPLCPGPPAAPPDMDNLRDPDTFTHANRPQNMPITPHESAVMHRHPYNRHERHCGGVVAQDLRDRPPQAQLARPWPAHAAPRSSPLFAPHPRSTCVSRPTARQVVNSNCRRAVTPASCRGSAARTPSATAPNLPGLGKLIHTAVRINLLLYGVFLGSSHTFF